MNDKILLITGFEPFGGQQINPSWEAVSGLPDSIGPWQLNKLLIPVEYSTAASCVYEKARALQPDVILCIGQAGGRSGITPEVVGINLRESASADNAGIVCQNQPVVSDGPAAYFSTVPVRTMVDAVRAAGIPCSLSYSAGAYVCNDVLYTLLHHFHRTLTRVGFIHVPYLPQQATDGKPSLSLLQIRQALISAINAL